MAGCFPRGSSSTIFPVECYLKRVHHLGIRVIQSANYHRTAKYECPLDRDQRVLSNISFSFSGTGSICQSFGLNLHLRESLVERIVAVSKSLRCGIGSTFGGIRRSLVCAPLEGSKSCIGNEHNETDPLHCKLYVIEPIFLCFGGYLLALWGWWRLKFSRAGYYRDLWLGCAGILVGCPISSLGLGIFLIRVF